MPKAYVRAYIIIYCILIADSVGAGAEHLKRRNTRSTLITVTDHLPACTKKVLDTAWQLYNLFAKM